MATKSKISGNKKIVKKSLAAKIVLFKNRLIRTVQGYVSRRPHRSFRRTLRRDYNRSIKISGYWKFTYEVTKLITANRSLFVWLMVFYGVLVAAFVGLASQETYMQFSDAASQAGKTVFSDGWSSIGQASVLLLTGMTGSLSPEISEVQQVYSVVILLLTWLSTVWIVRALLSGQRPRLRDAIYNSSAPIVSTGIVLFIMVIQLLPAAVATLALSSGLTSNLLSNGFIAMIVSLVAFLFVLLSAYWVTSTAFAIIIVTLPGMYPWRAIRAAGDLVIGRRLRILLRILWLTLLTGLVWSLSILLVILFDIWIKQLIGWLEWVPIVPIAMAVVTSASVIYSAVYLYLFYRKVVDDDAAPA